MVGLPSDDEITWKEKSTSPTNDFTLLQHVEISLLLACSWWTYDISLLISSLMRLLAIWITAKAVYPGSVTWLISKMSASIASSLALSL